MLSLESEALQALRAYARTQIISGNIRIAADGVYCGDYDSKRDTCLQRVTVVEYS